MWPHPQERLWTHPGKAALLSFIHPKLNSAHLADALCVLRKVAFRGPPNSPQLIDPAVLSPVSQLLLPTLPATVVTKALRILRLCAENAVQGHMAPWHTTVFRLVPLLKVSW